jgi:hypothetical protein
MRKKLEKLKKRRQKCNQKEIECLISRQEFLSAFLIIDATQGGSFKNINDKIILEILI